MPCLFLASKSLFHAYPVLKAKILGFLSGFTANVKIFLTKGLGLFFSKSEASFIAKIFLRLIFSVGYY